MPLSWLGSGSDRRCKIGDCYRPYLPVVCKPAYVNVVGGEVYSESICRQNGCERLVGWSRYKTCGFPTSFNVDALGKSVSQ